MEGMATTKGCLPTWLSKLVSPPDVSAVGQASMCQVSLGFDIGACTDISLLRKLIIYSEATHHVLSERDMFEPKSYKAVNRPNKATALPHFVRTGGGKRQPVLFWGKVILHSQWKDRIVTIVLHDVLHVPTLKFCTYPLYKSSLFVKLRYVEQRRCSKLRMCL
jgi:hypothetical protein